MTEAQIIAWFTAHPFWRNEVLVLLTAWSSYAETDWAAYKKSVLGDQTLTFSLKAHARIYPKVALIAILPPLVAELWHILVAASGPVIALLR